MFEIEKREQPSLGVEAILAALNSSRQKDEDYLYANEQKGRVNFLTQNDELHIRSFSQEKNIVITAKIANSSFFTAN